MKRVSSAHSDLVVFQHPRPWTDRLLGLGILAGIIGLAWVLYYLAGESRLAFSPMLMAGIGIVVGALLVIALYGVFSQGGLDIDRRRQVLVTWTNLFGVPVRRRTRRLAVFQHVLLDRRASGSQRTYVVELVATGESPISIVEKSDDMLAEQRALAESMARAIGCPVHDTTTGTLRVRPHDELDMSLGEQIRRHGDPFDPPLPPPGCRITQHLVDGNVSTYRLPAARPPVALTRLLFDSLALPVAVIFLPSFFLPAYASIWIGTALVGMALGAIVRYRRLQKSAIVVLVDDHHLRIEGLNTAVKLSLFAPQAREANVTFPLAEIEEIEAETDERLEAIPDHVREYTLFQFGGLHVRSDARQFVFGSHLRPTELAWLALALSADLARRHVPGQ